jgi:hypothetical protein
MILLKSIIITRPHYLWAGENSKELNVSTFLLNLFIYVMHYKHLPGFLM